MYDAAIVNVGIHKTLSVDAATVRMTMITSAVHFACEAGQSMCTAVTMTETSIVYVRMIYKYNVDR